MKALQNNFTTPEQSKRLLWLGVPADSADCYWDKYRILPSLLFNGDTFQDLLDAYEPEDRNEFLPCWSVGRLMEIYDLCNKEDYGFMYSNDEWWPTHTIQQRRGKGVKTYVEFLVTCYEMAIEKGILDFSKLEE